MLQDITFYFFYNLKVCGNSTLSNLPMSFFNSTFSLHVSVILVIFTIFQTLHQQKDDDSLKVQMMIRIFLVMNYSNWGTYTAFLDIIQFSCLKNSMDRKAWGAIVHGVTKSQTWLSTHTQDKVLYSVGNEKLHVTQFSHCSLYCGSLEANSQYLLCRPGSQQYANLEHSSLIPTTQYYLKQKLKVIRKVAGAGKKH